MASEVVNQVVRLDQCRPHPRNYNRHTKQQIERIRLSLRRFGQVRSVVVQAPTLPSPGVPGEGNFLIVAGHGVVEAAQAEGMAELRADVLPAAWPEAQVLAYLAADNELARLGDPDEAQLAQLVLDVQAQMDEELAALAAGTDERLRELLRIVSGEPPEDPGAQMDKAEELREKWGVESGQLWELGEHRLICGDCTDPQVVIRVMGGG